MLTDQELQSLREAAADELERMRLEVMNAEGMDGCMAMFRDDMIRAGVITDATPPMFMTEAILSALHKAGWRPALPMQKRESPLSGLKIEVVRWPEL